MILFLLLLCMPLCFGMEKARALGHRRNRYQVLNSMEGISSDDPIPQPLSLALEDSSLRERPLAPFTGNRFHLPGQSPEDHLAYLAGCFKEGSPESEKVSRQMRFWQGIRTACRGGKLSKDLLVSEEDVLRDVSNLADALQDPIALDHVVMLAEAYKTLEGSDKSRKARSYVIDKANKVKEQKRLAQEHDASMYQQGSPGDYECGVVMPLDQLYPPVPPKTANPDKAKPAKRSNYHPKDPYALLFKLSRRFEGNRQALGLINSMIRHLHALDPEADHRGLKMDKIHASTPAFCLGQLAVMSGQDLKALSDVYAIALGCNSVAPNAVGTVIFEDIEARGKAAWHAKFCQPEEAELEISCHLGPFSRSFGPFEVREVEA